MAQRRTAHNNQANQYPGMHMIGDHRIMIADHHQENRQRQIGVVQRALLARDAKALDQELRRAAALPWIFSGSE